MTTYENRDESSALVAVIPDINLISTITVNYTITSSAGLGANHYEFAGTVGATSGTVQLDNNSVFLLLEIIVADSILSASDQTLTITINSGSGYNVSTNNSLTFTIRR